MKKSILRSGMLALVGIGFMAGSAAAMPWDDLVNNQGYILSGDMDYWTPTDFTTNVTGNSLFQLRVENAGFESSFGLFIYDGMATTKFEVFAASMEPFSERTLTFRENGGVFQVTKNYTADPNDDDQWFTFDSSFGFYYDVYQDGASLDYTFFTDNNLNTVEAGIEHIMTAYNPDDKVVYIYLDDQTGQGDGDFDDMTVFANDLKPVPEPATMLLFGVGLAGLAGMRRRKNS